ncbi:S-formylglutathione hydrolase [Hydromonas duriensis]|uniref:S-formylglutathione hydrolase n=1 Tax=Hydromonas duriensis TaxID=1527608 RepID=A0A4R6Y3M9_9BURK|nr:S-formylglutathione hydrolase [Hydromonas duriensis]TDR30970.1 S-formylglutathione hydrolase [Hydromonas duriensis]
MQQLERKKCFNGRQDVWQHASEVLNCTMRFGVFIPERAQHERCPVLFWLSGLTCNEQNFMLKAGAQRYADEHGLILVMPDTSPRGDGVADDAAYNLGQGAGFYVNATQSPWRTHFNMYEYIVHELPALIHSHFPTNGRQSISGHSMGGHGALICALKHPERYFSVSAFAPIVAPTQVPWGQKAFQAYLGDDTSAWREWDACELVKIKGFPRAILIDQGTADEFLDSQLKPSLFVTACQAAGVALNLRLQPEYDHSYYFISTFIGEHMAFHAHALRQMN